MHDSPACKPERTNLWIDHIGKNNSGVDNTMTIHQSSHIWLILTMERNHKLFYHNHIQTMCRENTQFLSGANKTCSMVKNMNNSDI